MTWHTTHYTAQVGVPKKISKNNYEKSAELYKLTTRVLVRIAKASA